MKLPIFQYPKSSKTSQKAKEIGAKIQIYSVKSGIEFEFDYFFECLKLAGNSNLCPKVVQNLKTFKGNLTSKRFH